ncbi:MAG: carboxypeptidase regulatory-like domain-containing protein [Gemmatimonadales bacterium]|jgi:hypothetical protein
MRFTSQNATRLGPLVLILLLTLPVSLGAQETRGAIGGRILAMDGTPLSGTEVRASSPSLLGERVTLSVADGRFRLVNLPTGVYLVELKRIGHRTVRVEDVHVRLGEVTSLAGGTIRLEETAVAIAPLVVSADGPLIDLTTPTIETSIENRVFLDLPTDRDYRDLALLTPQASESFRGDQVNISGATGLDNLTFVDGLNTTDPFFGSLGTKLPYNFVREFQVKTNGYAAEYGGAAGGIFNAVTRSGGDVWSVETYGYFSGAGMTADALQGAGDFVAQGADRYDFGLSVGGPLIADRLWFFGAYDPTFARNQIEIPGWGFYDDDLTEHLFAGKLDWRAGDRTDVVFTAFGDPTTHDRVGGGPFSGDFSVVLDPDVFLNRVERGGFNLSTEVTHRPGDRLVLDLGLGGQWNSSFDGPRPGDDVARYTCLAGADCAPGVPPGAIGGGFGEEYSYDGRRLSARAAVSLLAGSHTPKVGVAYEDYGLSPYTSRTSGEGVILDFGPNPPPDVDSRWLVIVDSRRANLHGRVVTAFAQDSWALNDAFRLNYGLRWDGQYLIDSQGAVGQSFTDQWQPRVGFVWSPGEPGRNKISGSVGRFYQMMPLRLSTQEYTARVDAENSQAYYDDDPRQGGQAIDGTFFAFCCQVQPQRDLRGTHYDEATLGYERTVGSDLRLGAHGIYRTLREVVNLGIPAEGPGFPGNPGRGDLSNLDRPQRDYLALVLTADYATGGVRLSGSYVLSRNYGNFPGLYTSDGGFAFPNQNGIFQQEISMQDNEGLLPNDQTHRLKLWGSYRFGFGLTAGTFLSVASGTPISRYEGFFGIGGRFLSPRGSEGRYPALWDWSVRLQYPIELGAGGRRRMNLVADFLHIGNPQTVAWRSEIAQFNFSEPFDPAGGFPNVAFGEPLAYEPPFSLRLGVEVGI